MSYISLLMLAPYPEKPPVNKSMVKIKRKDIRKRYNVYLKTIS